MKKYIYPLIFYIISYLTVHLHAKLTEVTPGGLQSAINLATEEDTLVLHTGDYDETITIPKALTLIPMLNAKVFITGDLTISNTLKKTVLRDLNFGGKLSIENSVDIVVDDCSMKGDVVIENTKFRFHNSNFAGDINIGEGSTTLITKCVIGGAVNSTDTARTFTLLQSEVNGLVVARSLRKWICYNSINNGLYLFNGESYAVGNTVDVNSNSDNFFLFKGRKDKNKLSSYQDYVDTNIYLTKDSFGLYNTKFQVLNNTINSLQAASSEGIVFNNKLQSLTVQNNFKVRFDGKYQHGGNLGLHPDTLTAIDQHLILLGIGKDNGWISIQGNSIGDLTAQYAKVYAGYNSITTFTGGVVPLKSVTLSETETGVDLGPPEPEFNDHDGTRNDIGIQGGHSYDPNGWDTDKPIVLMNKLDVQYVKKGTSTIRLNTRGATALTK